MDINISLINIRYILTNGCVKWSSLGHNLPDNKLVVHKLSQVSFVCVVAHFFDTSPYVEETVSLYWILFLVYK